MNKAIFSLLREKKSFSISVDPREIHFKEGFREPEMRQGELRLFLPQDFPRPSFERFALAALLARSPGQHLFGDGSGIGCR